MPTPGPRATFSWQFLPLPAGIRDIRATARSLRRWGMLYGFRPGTADADKVRVIAARYVHLIIPPATIPVIFDENEEVTAGRLCDPWTLDELRDEILAWIDDRTPATWSENSYPGFSWFETRLGFYALNQSIVLYLARALATVQNGWNFNSAQASKLFDLLTAAETPGLLPWIATAPWQIAAMHPFNLCEALGEWNTLDEPHRWLCHTPTPGAPGPSWRHRRPPSPDRRRAVNFL